jgi:hypothetical protein
MNMTADKQKRPLYEIAEEIRNETAASSYWWKARPNVEAMLSLDKITDMYMFEPADMVVRYALGNLMGWRGDKAKAIKAELREML